MKIEGKAVTMQEATTTELTCLRAFHFDVKYVQGNTGFVNKNNKSSKVIRACNIMSAVILHVEKRYQREMIYFIICTICLTINGNGENKKVVTVPTKNYMTEIE